MRAASTAKRSRWRSGVCGERGASCRRSAHPQKVNARPGEGRAFGQFFSEPVVGGETTFGRSLLLQLRPLCKLVSIPGAEFKHSEIALYATGARQTSGFRRLDRPVVTVKNTQPNQIVMPPARGRA